MKISGLIPSTITPFDASGAVDYDSLSAHIRAVGSATGLFGLAVNGRAGEILALDSEERRGIIAASRSVPPQPLRLIAGLIRTAALAA